jgi:hypothetical protein
MLRPGGFNAHSFENSGLTLDYNRQSVDGSACFCILAKFRFLPILKQQTAAIGLPFWIVV